MIEFLIVSISLRNEKEIICADKLSEKETIV